MRNVAFHSITSSARIRSDGGILNPMSARCALPMSLRQRVGTRAQVRCARPRRRHGGFSPTPGREAPPGPASADPASFERVSARVYPLYRARLYPSCRSSLRSGGGPFHVAKRWSSGIGQTDSCRALRGGDGSRHSRRRFCVLQKPILGTLAVNVGIVLVFGAFYFRFLKLPKFKLIHCRHHD